MRAFSAAMAASPSKTVCVCEHMARQVEQISLDQVG
jgi:hypothetical protein